MKYKNKHSLQASIPESYEILHLLAGLLTYSRISCLPNPSPEIPDQTSGFDLNTVIELTAAGQLRNHTVFPFNPGTSNNKHREPKSDAKVLKYPANNKLLQLIYYLAFPSYLRTTLLLTIR